MFTVVLIFCSPLFSVNCNSFLKRFFMNILNQILFKKNKNKTDRQKFFKVKRAAWDLHSTKFRHCCLIVQVRPFRPTRLFMMNFRGQITRIEKADYYGLDMRRSAPSITLQKPVDKGDGSRGGERGHFNSVHLLFIWQIACHPPVSHSFVTHVRLSRFKLMKMCKCPI